MSATEAPLTLIAEKASCPGVSMKVIFLRPSEALCEDGLSISTS